MKNEMLELVEVDSTLGEITEPTAKMAMKMASDLRTMSVAAFVFSAISGPLGVSLLLGGCHASGTGCAFGGALLLIASMKTWRKSLRYDAIRLAFLQRDSLKRLRGDGG